MVGANQQQKVWSEGTLRTVFERSPDAILLLDELYRRVPQRMRQKDMLPIYQHPTNVLGVEAIANHLELMAKALPDA